MSWFSLHVKLLWVYIAVWLNCISNSDCQSTLVPTPPEDNSEFLLPFTSVTTVPSPGVTTVPSPLPEVATKPSQDVSLLGVTTVPSPGVTTVPSPGVTIVPSPGVTTVPSPGVTTVPSPGVTIVPSPEVATKPSQDVSLLGYCPSENVGTVEASGVYSWPETEGGTLVYISCPYDPTSFATRECIPMLPQKEEGFTFISLWGPVDTKNCPHRNKQSQNIFVLSQTPLNPGNVINATRQIRALSTPGSDRTSGDIANIATILENIAVVKEVDGVIDDFLSTVDNVLDAPSQNIIRSQQATNSSLRIVAVLNTLLEAINISKEGSFQRILGNYAIDVSSVSDARLFTGVTFSGNINDALSDPLRNTSVLKTPFDDTVVNSSKATTIRFPRTLFNESSLVTLGPQTIILALYKETKFFRVVPKPPKSLNSFVVAGRIRGLSVSNLTHPVEITFADLKRGDKNGSLCSFWNFERGNWSQDGCSLQKILPDGRIVCNCNHLTNFAVLMDIHPDEETSHVQILGVISYVGCALSLVGLVLTIITILLIREIRRKVPGQILLNFCIALSLTLIVFLAAAERSKTSSMVSCRAAAVALHYFVLVVFMWMAIEAFNMYLGFVKVMPSYFPKFFLKCCIVAWGVPAVIVSITVGVAHEKYGDNKYCRLHGVPFLVSFLAPVMLILVGNCIAFVLIFRSILTSGNMVQTTSQKISRLQRARQGAAILVLLGLTWLFGVLAINDAKVVFQYLFCIFNSLQGLLVFIFYCVLSKENRKKYRSFWRNKGTMLGRKGRITNLKMNTPVQGNHVEKSYNESNSTKTNTGESAFVLSNSSIQSSENTRRISSFEVPVVEWNETSANVESVQDRESSFVLSNSSIQSSENTRRIYSFEVPVVEWNEISANAESVQDPESAFTANEIVLKILNPASVEYTVNGKSHYVTIKHITLKNNVKN